MTGWQWCGGAKGRCYDCERFVVGVWRHWCRPDASNMSVCAECAGGKGK